MSIAYNLLSGTDLTTPHVSELVASVPWDLIYKIRTHCETTPDEDVFKALDYIGIEPICELVAKGAMVVDLAKALDLPLMKISKWLKADIRRLEMLLEAEGYSADTNVSLASKLLMNVAKGDTDAIRVAKIKADHMKWLAGRQNKDKYGERVNVNHSTDTPVTWNITIGGNHLDHTQKQIIDI